MLTEQPDIQADIPGLPNPPARNMANLEAMNLPVAIRDLATIVTPTTAVEAATLVGSKSTTKATLGVALAGVATPTRTTTAHHLAARTRTWTGLLLGLLIRDLRAEMPYRRALPVTDKMTASPGSNSTTTTMGILTSVREIEADLLEGGMREAKEIEAASVVIRT